MAVFGEQSEKADLHLEAAVRLHSPKRMGRALNVAVTRRHVGYERWPAKSVKK
jgi:hypothetical protein